MLIAYTPCWLAKGLHIDCSPNVYGTYPLIDDVACDL